MTNRARVASRTLITAEEALALPLEGIQDLLLGDPDFLIASTACFARTRQAPYYSSQRIRKSGTPPDAVADSSVLFEKANAGNLLPSRSSERSSVLRSPPAGALP